MFLRFTFPGLRKNSNTLEQIILTVNGQDNYGKKTFFKLFLSFRVEKWEIFPSATLQRNNEISNKSNSLGLRKDMK